jgi:hypothetical protein
MTASSRIVLANLSSGKISNSSEFCFGLTASDVHKSSTHTSSLHKRRRLLTSSPIASGRYGRVTTSKAVSSHKAADTISYFEGKPLDSEFKAYVRNPFPHSHL